MRDENERKTCACNYASQIDLNVFALSYCMCICNCACVCKKVHIQCISLAYDSNRNIAIRMYDKNLPTVPIRIPAYSYSSPHQITLTYILYYTPFYIYDMRLRFFNFMFASATAITHYVYGAVLAVVDALVSYLS